jgi:hypothetical protein
MCTPIVTLTVVRCPYCVLDDDFRPMLAHLDGATLKVFTLSLRSAFFEQKCKLFGSGTQLQGDKDLAG